MVMPVTTAGFFGSLSVGVLLNPFEARRHDAEIYSCIKINF